ncbi:hypothetical protein PIB19_08770 [Sphingomonas sp. 7/4-4]|uniref:hypothetical protein n=1 Tax=Sphingomonas sp. 7/4-4 TaxID=3018446 RepID=UPI0022F399A9|nr:hypothetical protein [Sphingomonas sp. 7/4-4]WBY09381.1 hypothetical protein PIB19_08770 [Sphingomonas sp. 7/4-4]
MRVEPAPDAKPAYCFDNSVAQALRHGGEAVYGWAIWRWPGRWFEAEHHAVWRRPEGDLLDVTPQAGDPPRVLFLPDPSAPYDPATFRPNIMAPDGHEALVREYIALVAKRGEITRPYWEPGMDVLPLFSPRISSGSRPSTRAWRSCGRRWGEPRPSQGLALDSTAKHLRSSRLTSIVRNAVLAPGLCPAAGMKNPGRVVT